MPLGDNIHHQHIKREENRKEIEVMDLWQQQRRQPVQGDMYAERSLCGQRCNLAGINRIQNNRQCRSIERAKKSLQKIVQAGRCIHDETVVLLSKLKVDHHIEIELKMDELDLTAAESKATYDEIKAYVLNKYGLKVSQLYIAQIKRKCGIIERKNYNVSKKEDAKVPQCPPEKEAAIMDALKHFQMI